MTTDGRYRRLAGLLALLLIFSLVIIKVSLATPVGAAFTNITTSERAMSTPDSFTSNRGTITTVVLNATQQDQHWKAYVGNVSGALTLDDASNNTIYDWSFATITGEVYASNTTLDFSSVACANITTLNTYMVKLNMTASEVDSITSTFNSTNHDATVVAGTTLSSCNMTSLYVNNASQGQNNTADFQEFLMQDANQQLVYVAIINDDTTGYNGYSYDFQLIVGESHVQSPLTYYFYVELG